MAKRIKGGRMSQSELDTRRFHKQITELKKYCEEQGIVLHNWNDAENDEQCVASSDEYEIGAVREYLNQDHESFFTEEDNYAEVSEKFIRLLVNPISCKHNIYVYYWSSISRYTIPYLFLWKNRILLCMYDYTLVFYTYHHKLYSILYNLDGDI